MCDVHMGRLRIMVRGVEQCVRLIWSVIVLRWSYTDFRFRAMPCIKSSQIDSSRAVAGRGLEYGGHDDAGVYHTTSVDPHACSKSCVELYPRLVFLQFFYPRAKPPTFTPAAARSEQLLLRRRLGELRCSAGDCVSGAVSEISF